MPMSALGVAVAGGVASCCVAQADRPSVAIRKRERRMGGLLSGGSTRTLAEIADPAPPTMPNGRGARVANPEDAAFAHTPDARMLPRKTLLAAALALALPALGVATALQAQTAPQA